MKFWEAMKKLEEGNKIKNKNLGNPMALGILKSVFCVLFRDDWEVDEESVQLLSFQDVVKGLMKGKRFKRLAWKDNIGIEVVIEKDTETWIRSWNGRETTYFRVEDLEATDWVEVKDDPS